MSLREAINRRRASLWLSVAASAPQNVAAAAAKAAATDGTVDSSLLLFILDQTLTYRCILLMHANSSSCSNSDSSNSVAAQQTQKHLSSNTWYRSRGNSDKDSPTAVAASAASAASAAAARVAAGTMRLSHGRLLLLHARAAMACLLLLFDGSNCSSASGSSKDEANKCGKTANDGGSSSNGSKRNSSMLQLVAELEWEAAAAGSAGLLLPISGAGDAIAAASSHNIPSQQHQHQQLLVAAWRSFALSVLQQIGDLLLHAIQAGAGDSRSSVR